MKAVTLEQLRAIAPHAPDVTEALNAAMAEFQIDTAQRQAAFLAQCAHESNEFRALVEEASGDAYERPLVDGKLAPLVAAGHIPVWQRLGNLRPGDGRRFKGRSPGMITGRANYQRLAGVFGVDFVAHPEWLALPIYGFRGFAWWWEQHGLNELADEGSFDEITKIINGGFNGKAQRDAYHALALTVLGAAAVCA